MNSSTREKSIKICIYDMYMWMLIPSTCALSVVDSPCVYFHSLLSVSERTSVDTTVENISAACRATNAAAASARRLIISLN